MKVLIITAGRYPVPAVKGGAVANLVEHLIKGNSKKKYVDLFVSSPYDSKAKEESKKYKNCSFVFFKTPRILTCMENILYKFLKLIFRKKDLISIKSIFSFLWFVLKNSLFIKKNDFDYIIIENTARLFWCIKLFGNRKKYKGKVVYHLHNKPVKIGGCEKVINECKSIVCVSEFVKEAITSHKCNLYIKDKNKVQVLYNSIDINKFHKISNEETLYFKKKLGIQLNDRVILFSGRIDSEKGVLQVLESLNFIKNQNVKIVVVGSSFYGMKVKTPFEEKIMNMALKNKDKVIFTGYMDYNEMPLAYGICEIAVLPSLCDEAAGLTIIEAMACEKPVITTKMGGIPEYTNVDCAILLDKNNLLSKNIATNIDSLLSNTQKMTTMGKNGRKIIINDFDSKFYMEKMAHILKTE